MGQEESPPGKTVPSAAEGIRLERGRPAAGGRTIRPMMLMMSWSLRRSLQLLTSSVCNPAPPAAPRAVLPAPCPNPPGGWSDGRPSEPPTQAAAGARRVQVSLSGCIADLRIVDCRGTIPARAGGWRVRTMSAPFVFSLNPVDPYMTMQQGGRGGAGDQRVAPVMATSRSCGSRTCSAMGPPRYRSHL